MAGASVASTAARIEECVISENVIHLCSSAGGCQAVLIPYQLLSGEWAEKKNADRITAASFTNQENKILASWCWFSSKAFHLLHSLSTCDYDDEYNLEQFKKKKKQQAKVFRIFPFRNAQDENLAFSS